MSDREEEKLDPRALVELLKLMKSQEKKRGRPSDEFYDMNDFDDD